MNFSLTQILQIADEIHGKVFDEENSITVSDHINSIHQLRAYIEQIKSITQRIETIHHTCLNKIKKYVDKRKLDANNTDRMRTAASVEGVISRFSAEKPARGCPTGYTTIDIVPNIKINVKVVSDINMIPNVNLYWVNGQFAIRINNMIINGNIGNIYNKEGINKIMKVKNVDKCSFGSECKRLTENKECPFYHDPGDKDQNSDCDHKQFIRNYVNSSWIHSAGSLNKKNKHIRHIGSRDSLNHDIDKILRYDRQIIDDEIDMRVNQTMHDILVLMALKDRGAIF